jgi:predicted glycosyltransferase
MTRRVQRPTPRNRAAQTIAAAAPGQPATFEPAAVVLVQAGGGADGQSLVTVRWRGADHLAAHMAHYTPTVGDTVTVLVQPGRLTVLGKPIGTP